MGTEIKNIVYNQFLFGFFLDQKNIEPSKQPSFQDQTREDLCNTTAKKPCFFKSHHPLRIQLDLEFPENEIIKEISGKPIFQESDTSQQLNVIFQQQAFTYFSWWHETHKHKEDSYKKLKIPSSFKIHHPFSSLERKILKKFSEAMKQANSYTKLPILHQRSHSFYMPFYFRSLYTDVDLIRAKIVARRTCEVFLNQMVRRNMICFGFVHEKVLYQIEKDSPPTEVDKVCFNALHKRVAYQIKGNKKPVIYMTCTVCA